MNIRKLPPSQGLQWMREAVNIGSRNPRAVFGAAGLFVVTLYVIAALAVLPVAVGLQGQAELTMAQALGSVVPMFIALTLVLPILLAGLMHVVREAEAGRPVGVRDLFAPVGNGRAGPLAALGIVQILLNLVGGLLVIALAGSNYWPEYFKAIEGAMSGHVGTPPEPDHPLLMMLVQLAFNYLSYSLMLLCVPLIAFSRQGILDALRLGLRASIANLGANLLASVLFVAGLVVAALVTGLIAVVVGVIAAMLHPALGAAVSLLVYGAFAVVVLVVLVSVSYVAWRDTFEGEGEGDAGPGPVATHFEA